MKYTHTLEQIKAALIKAWRTEGDLCFHFDAEEDKFICDDWDVFVINLLNPEREGNTTGSSPVCGYCSVIGHNRDSCPYLEEDEDVG